MPVQFDRPDLQLYESALFRTVSTLIIGKDHLLLVDPTWLPQEIEVLHARVEELRRGRTCYLLFTHSDYDHIIGFGRFEDWHTLASEAFVGIADPDEPIRQILDFDDAYYITRGYPVRYPRIDTSLAGNGVSRLLGSEEYLFFRAPGHNPDGIIALNRQRGILIVGDYLSNIEFPYVYHSVSAYRATLDRLEGIIRDHEIRVLVSGHGDHATLPSEMLERVRESREYLDELEAAVRHDRTFDLDRLFTRYRFPGIMRKYHADNLALMKQHVAEEELKAPDQS
ncbi:MBL fold metallo-hydrolase [Neolewinella litorea]|uniref:MBL fold metallo-hydrolase n=1 Tax=Neolewinella litorea TaxID=2562452 RepID=A0A4S4NM34_9BACT|nr:MBL fold metallo-hydrolase [Neolewinella litorea]THH39977.1 MBL fold metallo-hydrolase [Neolewinella litorea]